MSFVFFELDSHSLFYLDCDIVIEMVFVNMFQLFQQATRLCRSLLVAMMLVMVQMLVVAQCTVLASQQLVCR